MVEAASTMARLATGVHQNPVAATRRSPEPYSLRRLPKLGASCVSKNPSLPSSALGLVRAWSVWFSLRNAVTAASDVLA
jgi:hypothetical protein